MEPGESGGSGRRRRRFGLVLGVLALLLLVLILAVVLGLALPRATEDFKSKFIDKCQKFKEYNCEDLWGLFQQAYVNQDPCEVSSKAFDPLFTAAPLKPKCNRMMFWSKTTEVVHEFTKKSDCFQTLEDSNLGSILDGLTWCGKKGSNETFTTDCPESRECNNTFRSFWNKASADFAAVACGNVTVMLNSSIPQPFHPSSTFARVEVKNLNSTKVRNLSVVLVSKMNPVTNCSHKSLQELKKELKEGIGYNCKEVSESQLEECSSQMEKRCGPCW